MGYVNMPFWTFFIATALGKGVVKVNGQAAFFISLFSKQFFSIVLVPIAALASSVLQIFKSIAPALAERDMGEFLSEKRSKIIRQFEKQGRFTWDQASGGKSYISESDLLRLYSGFDDAQGSATRVLDLWDVNKDGSLTEEEIQPIISGTDGKFSLGTLDPETGGDSWMKMGWDLFLAGVIAFFFISLINQMAETKYAELQEKGKKKKKA